MSKSNETLSPVSREWFESVALRVGWDIRRRPGQVEPDKWPVDESLVLWARAAEAALNWLDDYRELATKLYKASSQDFSCDDWNKVYGEFEQLEERYQNRSPRPEAR